MWTRTNTNSALQMWMLICFVNKNALETSACAKSTTPFYVVLSKQTALLQSLNMWPSNKPFKHL